MMHTAQLSLSRVQTLLYALKQEQHTLLLMSRVAKFSSGGTDKEPREPERMDAAFQKLKLRLAGISEPTDTTYGNIPDTTVDTLENASRALEVTLRYLEAVGEQITPLKSMCEKLIAEISVQSPNVRPNLAALGSKLSHDLALGTQYHGRIRSSSALNLLL
jgi:hypothetical protein